MKERPILFSGPMVRAILEDRKTQTRRVVKLPKNWVPNHDLRPDMQAGALCIEPRGRAVTDATEGTFDLLSCPFGIPGDRLWVRETFALNYFECAPWLAPEQRHGYRADWSSRAAEVVPEPKWTPSIHMPRWASRITLEVTGVRVERLNDISLDDCVAEGVKFPENARSVGNFAVLWDSINGAGSWAANPWVWVIAFKKLKP